jgi:integrase
MVCPGVVAVLKLTSAVAKSLTLPPGQRDKTFFDSEVPAFGVRVRAGGSRNWVCQYKIAGKNRRLVLGAVTALDAGKARGMAKDALAAVRLGKDPVGGRADAHVRAGETFGALLPRFLARQRGRLKPRSYQESERHLTVQCRPLHPRPLDQVDRRAIAMRLAELAESAGPTAANRCRASLSAFFTWLAREGIVEANPVQFTNRAQEVGARTRFLSDDELAKVWRSLGNDQYSTIVKLLALTGARREEIGALRWAECDLDRETIALPGERTKNRRPYEIPLSRAALELLKAQQQTFPDGAVRDFVFGRVKGFQDWAGSKSELDARCGVSGWVLHDLRRTLSTVAHERLGVPPHIVETLLSHVSGHKAGVAGTYNRAAYLDERRRVLERWADHIAGLVGEKPPAEVVQLRR